MTPIPVLWLLGSQTTDPAHPRSNGVEVLFSRLAKWIDPARIQLHVAYPDYGPLATVFSDQGIPLHPWPTFRGWDARVTARIRELLDLTKAWLVHTNSGPKDWYAARAARRRHASHVITRHVSYRDETISDLRRQAYYFVDRRCARLGSHWVAICEDGRQALLEQELPAERIHLIRNGIEPLEPGDGVAARREWGIPPEALVIGTAGRMEPVKRVDLLLAAFRRLSDDFPHAHLVLAGSGPLRDSLRFEARQMPCGDRIHFIGQQRRMNDFYAGLDLFAMTSEAEGVPNVLLEALSLGIPAVTSKVGGTSEAVRDGETGRLFPLGDLEGLVAVLRKSLSAGPDPVMREAGIRLVREQFGLARCAEAYTALYEALAGKTR